MTLRDQLDQIARLSEAATQGEWTLEHRDRAIAGPGADWDWVVPPEDNDEEQIAVSKRNNPFIAALVNFWRSGGRELAEDGIRYRRLRKYHAIEIALLLGVEVGRNPEDELDAAIDAARAKEGKT